MRSNDGRGISNSTLRVLCGGAEARTSTRVDALKLLQDEQLCTRYTCWSVGVFENVMRFHHHELSHLKLSRCSTAATSRPPLLATPPVLFVIQPIDLSITCSTVEYVLGVDKRFVAPGILPFLDLQ